MVEEKKDLKYIVRIAGTDIDGARPLYMALIKVKGIKYSMSNAVCRLANIDKTTRVGALSDEQLKSINELIKNISGQVPSWLINRKTDRETGESQHLIGPDLSFAVENDLRRLKMIRSRKGLRHAAGLPVRGQRTRSNFRTNKGKGLGVIKKKIKQQAEGKEESKEDKKK